MDPGLIDLQWRVLGPVCLCNDSLTRLHVWNQETSGEVMYKVLLHFLNKKQVYIIEALFFPVKKHILMKFAVYR